MIFDLDGGDSVAHHVDVRIRAVNAYNSGAGSYTKVAALFGIGSASLKRWVRKHREQGTVEPERLGGYRKPIVSEKNKRKIERWIDKQPDLTIVEVFLRYNKGSNPPASMSTIGRVVRDALAFRRKKKRTAQPSKTKKARSKAEKNTRSEFAR